MKTDTIKHLKTYMRTNGISQRQLADKLGISESAVSRYVAYQRVPKQDILSKIEKIIGISTFSISDKNTATTKKQIEQLIRENIKHYTPQERLDLIHIIAWN